MPPTTDLRLLLASPSGSATAPLRAAVARLAAAFDIDVTVVGLPGAGDAAAADPTFAPGSGRVRVQRLDHEHDDPLQAIADLCARQTFDAVMAPPDPGPRLLRGWRGSLRSRVLAGTGVPLWTGGDRIPSSTVDAPVREVACLVDFGFESEPTLHRASALARRLDASLHVVAMLPPVDDGLLAAVAGSDQPLLPEAALARVEHQCGSRFRPEVDVVVGGRRQALDMVGRRGAPDVLFVQAPVWTSPWSAGISRALDRAGCAVVLVPDPVRRMTWSFETPGALVATSPAARRPERARAGALSAWPAGSAATS